jgi:hypothetical protein
VGQEGGGERAFFATTCSATAATLSSSTGGAWRWEYDGREFDRLPKDRGTRQVREGVPEALNELYEFFKNRSEFEAVRIIAFPISGNGG